MTPPTRPIPPWRAIADAAPLPLIESALGWAMCRMAMDGVHHDDGPYRELILSYGAGGIPDVGAAGRFLRARGAKTGTLVKYLEMTAHGRALLAEARQPTTTSDT